MPDARALLAAMAEELADLRTDVDGLATLMCDMVQHCPPESRAATLGQIQAFDLVAQRLDALRELSVALGSGETLQAALRAVPLADLTDRLARATRTTPDAPAGPSTGSPATAGDLMMFD